MAGWQDKFMYDDVSLDRIERSLSSERLAPYLELADGNRTYAVLLYERLTVVASPPYRLAVRSRIPGG